MEQMAFKTKEEMLKDALEARENEVLVYQINIDNYAMALEEIDGLSVEEKADLASFADQLRSLLESERFEQKKALIMLNVLRKQVS
jgi:hypothetical protein